MSMILGALALVIAIFLFLSGCAIATGVWKISRPQVRSKVALLTEAVGNWQANVNGTIPALKNHAVFATEGMVLVEQSDKDTSHYSSNRRLSDEAIRAISR